MVLFEKNIFTRFLYGKTLCVFFLLFVLPINALASPSMSLSLESAVLFALNESPQIMVAKEQVKQARFSEKEAESIYYPTVDVSAEFGREWNDPGVYEGNISTEPNFTTASVNTFSIKQVLFDGGLFKEIERRKKATESAVGSTKLSQREIIIETIEAYLDVYLYQEQYQRSNALYEDILRYTKLLKKAVEAGAESEARLEYAQARLDLSENRKAVLRSSLTDAKHKLQFYTKALPEFDVVKPQGLDLSDYDLDFYRELALKKNHDLQVARADIETAKVDIEKSEQAYYPKLSLNVTGKHDENLDAALQRDMRFMLKLDYNIFDGFAKDATLDRMKSREKELEYEEQSIRDDMMYKISQLYNQITSLSEQRTLKEKENKSYKKLQSINAVKFDQGDADIFEIIENEERLNNSVLELINLSVQHYKGSYEFLKYIGAINGKRFCESC